MSSRKPAVFRAGLILVTVLTLVLAACGDDEAETTTTEAVTTTEAPTTTAAPTTTEAPTTTATTEPAPVSYRLAGTAGIANDAFWITYMCGGTKAAEAAGSTIDWFPLPPSGEAAAEQANRDAVVTMQPDGVVFTPARGLPYEPDLIPGLMEAGIPVVIGNSVGEGAADFLAAYVSGAQDASVIEIGNLIAASAPEGGTVLVLGGLPGIDVLAARWEPARDAAVAANPNIEFVDEYEEFGINAATQIVSAAIVGYPDLIAVFAVSGPAGQGAVTAVEQAGKGGEVLVYSFDATPVNVQALRDGTIFTILSQPSGLMGEASVNGLIEYLNAHPGGGPVPPNEWVVEIPTMLLTLDNIDSETAAPYVYSETCE